MARVVVNVMPKAEILDPQGQAIAGALNRLGHAGISEVRQGKRFELEVDDAVDDSTLAEIAESIIGKHRDRGLDRQQRAMSARIGIITFPGTLDDVDAARAAKAVGAEAVSLWHADADLKGVDAVVVPGGFSYGDYLRAGAIARFAPVMGEVIAAAGRGMPVLGICNGFQVLCEAGLLPGALTRNAGLHFVCRDVWLQVASTTTAWTSRYEPGADLLVPLKSGEGRYVAAETVLDTLEGEDRVVFRYRDNPNGSMRDIAGICSANRRVVGLDAASRACHRAAHRPVRRRARVVLLGARLGSGRVTTRRERACLRPTRRRINIERARSRQGR